MINILLVIFGLVFGSFIAAYSYRFPRNIKISKGASFCDNCKRKITWLENIPVFSYLFLKGKCLRCKKKISPRYFLIEMSTALVFVVTYSIAFMRGDHNPFVLLYFLLMIILMEMIFLIDLEYQIIPDFFVFLGIGLSFIFILFTNMSGMFSSLFAGFLAATFLMILFLATKGRGMGLGDVKFAVLGGLVVGINSVFIWMLLSFLTGGIIGLILILNKKAGLKDKIAFGPFLVITIPIALAWGDQIFRILGI